MKTEDIVNLSTQVDNILKNIEKNEPVKERFKYMGNQISVTDSPQTDNQNQLDKLWQSISQIDNKASKYLLLALYQSKFPNAYKRNKANISKDELDTLVSYDEIVRDLPEAIKIVVKRVMYDKNDCNNKENLYEALRIDPNDYFVYNPEKRSQHVVGLNIFNRGIANIYSCIHSLLWGTQQLNKTKIENIIQESRNANIIKDMKEELNQNNPQSAKNPPKLRK